MRRAHDGPPMHAGQVVPDHQSVVALVAEQFPQWAALPVRRFPSDGTVNALFRLGDRLVARFPLLPTDDPTWPDVQRAIQAEVADLGTSLAVGVPVLRGLGRPGDGYPGHWSISEWLPGEPAHPGAVEVDALAPDVAAVVAVLRDRDTGGRRWNGHSRGGPLAERDAEVRGCIERSRTLVDAGAIGAAWERALAASQAPWVDRWIHADLMPQNLLVRSGRLSAVLDCDGLCVGDPAVDLMPAWNLFGPRGRASFRGSLDVDDAMWERGRGWAVCQAVVALPYYLGTNDAMVASSLHTLRALGG